MSICCICLTSTPLTCTIFALLFLYNLYQSKWEYWERPDIHTFGNIGWGGAVHAAMAPLATKVREELCVFSLLYMCAHYHIDAYLIIHYSLYLICPAH